MKKTKTVTEGQLTHRVVLYSSKYGTSEVSMSKSTVIDINELSFTSGTSVNLF